MLLLLVITSLFRTAYAQISTARFQHWYWYSNTYDTILHQNCSAQYAKWRDHYGSKWYKPDGPGYWTYYYPIIECLLDNATETDKAIMAASGVLLGLMPTILAYAGSNLEETALVAARRPLLAFLLALGSPAVPVLRTFEYGDVQKLLKKRSTKHGLTTALSQTTQAPLTRRLIVIAEFVLALAALMNNVLASHELGVRTYLSWSADVFFHPLLWTLLPGLVHLFGVWAFHLDVTLVRRSRPSGKATFRERLRFWAKDEFTPCASQDPSIFRYKPDSYTFLLVSWWAAILTLAHYIYGTVVFASVLFISVTEALKVLARFLASTLVCRIVVMYEISGMREASRRRTRDPVPGSEDEDGEPK